MGQKGYEMPRRGESTGEHRNAARSVLKEASPGGLKLTNGALTRDNGL